MIQERFVEEWKGVADWQAPSQVEQDLIISRALVDLYNDPHIKESLVFRGGTALNKIYIHPSARYSEDLDFVQYKAEPIGQTLDTIKSILTPWLGEPKWKATKRSLKVVFRYESIEKIPMKLKIEINTTEHLQVLPLFKNHFKVISGWHSGETDIMVYQLEELMATKLRALYQRRKGRDLFDLWYVSKNSLVKINDMISIFRKYCKYNNDYISRNDFVSNLELKRAHPDFQSDMNLLLPNDIDWNFNRSYEHVIENIINKI